ncbi:magnesium/cobalt transporter CorA [Neorhizobium petrolearium]|uniref:Magnesium transport protein CorA n=1 Tax=Neorhizobium petrolearium TaxID=515361 RepID=A0ABY8M3V8_9HYPH|nr:magnesium/cobalt transporter CorA [Neorhizobium petrolearium]MCC2608933.1 magnesium/cobalt transporter CorA [Neorhizobium petrolearium]WGI69177.1 magnesium/cobalt transporter CorA [Neorhizobium petrolearium]
MLRIHAYDLDRLVPVASDLPVVAPAPVADGALAVVWYDLINPTPEEERTVGETLGIAVPSIDEMEDIELSARLYQEDGAEFMTMTVLTRPDAGTPRKVPVTFIVKGQVLVTVRHAEPRPFDAFLARARKPNGAGLHSASGELIMTGLVEAIIDRMADTLERLGTEIDQISQSIFSAKAAKADKKTRDLQELIREVGQKGEFITVVRESLVSVSRVVAYYAALDGVDRKLSKELRQRLKLLQRDATSLGDHSAFLSGKINFLLDATLGLINLEQNQIIKIFSVAAVVFLPPTLVASVYGMNFAYQPELQWHYGYPAAIGLMIVSMIMPYVYFKRKGWL